MITGVKNQIYGKEKYKIKDQKVLLKITVPSDIPRLELTNWTGESEVLLPTGILFKCNDVHIEEYVVIFDVTAMQIDIPSSSNSVRKLFHSKTLPSENNYKKFGEIVINLFSKPSEYIKMVKKGYESALKYDIPVYVNKLLKIYKS